MIKVSFGWSMNPLGVKTACQFIHPQVIGFEKQGILASHTRVGLYTLEARWIRYL